MKKIAAFVIALIAAGGAQAQFKLPKALIAAHLVYAGPVSSDFSNEYKFGIGGELEGGVGLGKTMLLANIGYTSYEPHSNISKLNATTFKIGLRQYLIAGLFLNVNAGNATLKYSGTDGSTSKFVVEGGAGIKLLGFEVLANYGGFTTPTKVPSGNYFAGAFIVKAGFAIKI